MSKEEDYQSVEEKANYKSVEDQADGQSVEDQADGQSVKEKANNQSVEDQVDGQSLEEEADNQSLISSNIDKILEAIKLEEAAKLEETAKNEIVETQTENNQEQQLTGQQDTDSIYLDKDDNYIGLDDEDSVIEVQQQERQSVKSDSFEIKFIPNDNDLNSQEPEVFINNLNGNDIIEAIITKNKSHKNVKLSGGETNERSFEEVSNDSNKNNNHVYEANEFGEDESIGSLEYTNDTSIIVENQKDVVEVPKVTQTAEETTEHKFRVEEDIILSPNKTEEAVAAAPKQNDDSWTIFVSNANDSAKQKSTIVDAGTTGGEEKNEIGDETQTPVQTEGNAPVPVNHSMDVKPEHVTETEGVTAEEPTVDNNQSKFQKAINDVGNFFTACYNGVVNRPWVKKPLKGLEWLLNKLEKHPKARLASEAAIVALGLMIGGPVGLYLGFQIAASLEMSFQVLNFVKNKINPSAYYLANQQANDEVVPENNQNDNREIAQNTAAINQLSAQLASLTQAQQLNDVTSTINANPTISADTTRRIERSDSKKSINSGNNPKERSKGSKHQSSTKIYA